MGSGISKLVAQSYDQGNAPHPERRWVEPKRRESEGYGHEPRAPRRQRILRDVQERQHDGHEGQLEAEIDVRATETLELFNERGVGEVETATGGDVLGAAVVHDLSEVIRGRLLPEDEEQEGAGERLPQDRNAALHTATLLCHQLTGTLIEYNTTQQLKASNDR